MTFTVDEFIMLANILGEIKFAIKTMDVDISHTEAQSILDAICENGNGYELRDYPRECYYDALWKKLAAIK